MSVSSRSANRRTIQRIHYELLISRSNTVRNGLLEIFLSLLYYFSWTLSDSLLSIRDCYCFIVQAKYSFQLWRFNDDDFKMDDNLRGFREIWISLNIFYKIFDTVQQINIHSCISCSVFLDFDWFTFDDLRFQSIESKIQFSIVHLARWRATHVSVSLSLAQLLLTD